MYSVTAQRDDDTCQSTTSVVTYDSAERTERSVSDADRRVRLTVQRLQNLTRNASVQFAIEVGRVVVECLYGGDTSAWRERAHKDHTLRTLAASPELPISASALYRALSIYELDRETRGDVARAQHLGVSHVRAVLGLERAHQVQLLAAAEQGGWTVCRLEGEAARFRPATRARGGRRPIPRYVKTIRQIHQLTSPESLDGVEGWSSLASPELEELALKLSQAQQRLAVLVRALPRRVAKTPGEVR